MVHRRSKKQQESQYHNLKVYQSIIIHYTCKHLAAIVGRINAWVWGAV